ncbi:MAG TPA: hypothetical protein VLI04_14570 [Nocardioidaceae bacterium]|nr:hypothetical protein [Nocardioidaceae bacterium]
MGCCLALSLMVSFVRRGWFSVTRRQPAEVTAFAPPARRPAPGAAALAAPVLPACGSRVGSVLVFTGIAWLLLGLVGMHVLGWFAWAETSLLLDVAFHASGLWVAAFGGILIGLQQRPMRAVTA